MMRIATLLRDGILGCVNNVPKGLSLDPVKTIELAQKIVGERREFVLHDGEDDKKTEELHKFMEGVDWEGDGAGITILWRVEPGDTIVRGADGSVRVVKKGSGT
jgi:hypothetical protein